MTRASIRIAALASLALAACGTVPSSPCGPVAAADPARDRQAILAMQGEYEVVFDFRETVALQPGHARGEPQRSGGHEVVIVVEDRPERIVLQHLLVSRNGHVTKHWRQDWHYQASQRLEFSAEQTWTLRPVAPGLLRGAWTQCVYEVSDAPRYCGSGRWAHAHGVSTWTSDLAWRPLPRREHTVRDDYQALRVRNRHTIAPDGWAHEQDNLKVRRDAHGTVTGEVAREFGFNDYRRTTEVDFGPAYRYWDATAGYWARVRAAWAARVAEYGGVRLETGVDGMPIIEATFVQAARVEEGGAVPDAEIEAVLARWTGAPPTRD